ncbi:hypothetical protein [uncultured Aquitalea sp.]|uniref:hypothetical protein n=1 Tax=uncultured Aquitalea sp. TaxID=540272 RepID=UPI0025D06829|nr:hypothetical protein [uncultured Aquitalea sp.]
MSDKPAIDLKDYRQPMVTSIGVILGFLIGFLGQWVTESDFNLTRLDDRIVFFGSLAGAVFLFVALFRMLNIVPAGDVVAYYRRTLSIYMCGVLLAFSSILLSAFV